MTIHKFAAIDVGTNAMRLLITDVYENGEGEATFKKNALYRVPVRLGSDAFEFGYLKAEKKQKLISTLQAFKHLIDVHDVKYFQGCGTSALRESANGQEIVAEANKITGLNLRIISGQEEADIIYSTQISNEIDPDKFYLYMDVGGGSTDFTFFKSNKIVSSRSFKIGTVRLLLNMVKDGLWEEMKQWLLSVKPANEEIFLIGSGGNITRLFKMSLKGKQEPLYKAEIQLHYNYINEFSIDDRIKLLDLKPDRADVIIPAARIFLFVLDELGADIVYVPKIGLADGIVKRLFYNIFTATKKSL